MRIQYTLKVYPAGLGRSVYRTITICGTDTLDQLCMAILNAFDFTAEHLYEFCMDNKMYSEDCYRFNPMEDDLFDEDDAEGTDIALDELGTRSGGARNSDDRVQRHQRTVKKRTKNQKSAFISVKRVYIKRKQTSKERFSWLTTRSNSPPETESPFPQTANSRYPIIR